MVQNFYVSLFYICWTKWRNTMLYQMMKFILFCPVTGPISYSLRWVKQPVHLASMCIQKKQIFYLPRQALSPSTARSPVLSFISPRLLFKANGDKKNFIPIGKIWPKSEYFSQSEQNVKPVGSPSYFWTSLRHLRV